MELGQVSLLWASGKLSVSSAVLGVNSQKIKYKEINGKKILLY